MNKKKDSKFFIALILVFGVLLFQNSSLNNSPVEASSLKSIFDGRMSIYERDSKKVKGIESLDDDNRYEGTSIKTIEEGKLTKDTEYKILYNGINNTYLVYTSHESHSKYPTDHQINVMPNRNEKYEKGRYKYSESKSFEFVEEGYIDDSGNSIIKYFIFVDKDNGQLWLLIEDLDEESVFRPIEDSNIRDIR